MVCVIVSTRHHLGMLRRTGKHLFTLYIFLSKNCVANLETTVTIDKEQY